MSPKTISKPVTIGRQAPSEPLNEGRSDPNDLPPGPQRAAPHRPAWRRRLVWLGVGLAIVGGFVGWSATRAPAPVPGPVIAQSGTATMRAEVRPTRRATLAAISPGIVEALFVDAGQPVESKSPIARVQGPAGAEIVVAPWRGTLTTLQVHVGDTLTSGAVVGTVADLSQLQVETVDVDEFQVIKVRVGERVTLTIDALNQVLPGRIRTVALEPQLNAAGDSSYLVVIDPASRPPELRSGMTVRVSLSE